MVGAYGVLFNSPFRRCVPPQSPLSPVLGPSAAPSFRRFAFLDLVPREPRHAPRTYVTGDATRDVGRQLLLGRRGSSPPSSFQMNG